MVIEERAEIMRRIYRKVLAGMGHQTVARRLNEEAIPCSKRGPERTKNPNVLPPVKESPLNEGA